MCLERIYTDYNLLGVHHTLGMGRYLGVPSMVGSSKESTFAFVKDRIWMRISSSSTRTLYEARKEVMIKSVHESIPSFVMSTYMLPPFICEEIERIMNSYWWGSNGVTTGGIYWMLWKRLLIPKAEGCWQC